MANKRKDLTLDMVDTVNAYKATGRVVIVYPYRGEISINGGAAMSYDAAHKKMRECLERESI